MGQRADLHTLFKTLVDNVYFQPPSSTVMQYPCIKYERSNIRSKSADNAPYKLQKEYTVTVIAADPDSPIPDSVSKLPQCVFDRGFKADNLNHDVFTILY